jgi:hypothetical protein
MARRPEVTYLLKFHGDLRYPEDPVMTEDYDGFLRKAAAPGYVLVLVATYP